MFRSDPISIIKPEKIINLMNSIKIMLFELSKLYTFKIIYKNLSFEIYSKSDYNYVKIELSPYDIDNISFTYHVNDKCYLTNINVNCFEVLETLLITFLEIKFDLK